MIVRPAFWSSLFAVLALALTLHGAAGAAPILKASDILKQRMLRPTVGQPVLPFPQPIHRSTGKTRTRRDHHAREPQLRRLVPRLSQG